MYNIDELGLFINLLSDKSMCLDNERDAGKGNKGRKARVTVLLGSNADGSHKLEPLYREIEETPVLCRSAAVPVHIYKST